MMVMMLTMNRTMTVLRMIITTPKITMMTVMRAIIMTISTITTTMLTMVTPQPHPGDTQIAPGHTRVAPGLLQDHTKVTPGYNAHWRQRAS